MKVIFLMLPFGFILGLLGFLNGLQCAYKSDQKMAIAHQSAHYDPKTGNFTWNLPEEK